jgi:hypothetical protein
MVSFDTPARDTVSLSRAGHRRRAFSVTKLSLEALFCNTLKLSLFIFEIVAFCNGGSPISVTNSGSRKNLMVHYNWFV